MVAVAAPPVDPCRRRRRRARSSPPPRPCGGFTVSSKTRSGRERLVTVALCSPFCARLLRSPSAAALGPSHHRDSRHIADRLGARVAPVAPRVVPVAPRVVPVAPRVVPQSRRRVVPLGAFHGATGTATGATGAFSKRQLGFTHGRLGPHWGRLAEPTRGARGGNSPGRLHGPPEKKAPRGGEGDDSQARVARGPGPTRRSEWELATTVRAATSCAAPSYHPTFPHKP